MFTYNFHYSYLHSCFLLLASTRATILRVGLVELPSKVECEGTTGWIIAIYLTDAIDDAAVFVGIEYIVATQVKRQRSETAQVEVALHAQVAPEGVVRETEVGDIALRRIAEACVQSPAMRQFYGVVPSKVCIRMVEGDLITVGTG